MYTTYNSKSLDLPGFGGSQLGQPLTAQDFFNPPAWYQSTAPNQIPVQTWPMSGGYGPSSPYGPYPGWFLGQRIIDTDDADRIIKAKQQQMFNRSLTSSNPVERYINPEGSLDPSLMNILTEASKAKKEDKKDKKKKEDKKTNKELSGLEDYFNLKYLVLISVIIVLGYLVKRKFM